MGISTSHFRVLRSRRIILAFLALATLGATAMALEMGATGISAMDALLERDINSLSRVVFFEIRMPRVILAIFVGMALGSSGAALQGLFRNPLADPSLIGVSSGAALGAVIYISLETSLPAGLSFLAPYLLPLAAVTGAITATTLLYIFSQRFGQLRIATLLLMGVALNSLASVGIGAFQYLSEDTQLRTLIFWMMGSFGRGSWTTIYPTIIIISIANLCLIRQVQSLDRLQLGEHEARHIGVDTHQLKRVVITTSAVMVGSSVALSGIIGFIGLMVPHLVRLMGGATHHYVLIGSSLLGASLSVLADLISRTIIQPAEIPVGLVTNALGAPFFLWLVTRVRTQ